uniref:tRNA phosphotransferase 1 n=1 Tax=Sus scrofa TaxID=9823 RepID=A0A8D1YVZ7_PIG
MLVHGTFWRHWPSILLKGLSRQGRTHIHLAPGLPGDPGVISGMRPNCEVAVFINGPQALAGESGHSRDRPGPSERALSHISGSVCRWNPLLPLCQWGDPDSRER